MSDPKQDRINERRWEQFQENDGFEQANCFLRIATTRTQINLLPELTRQRANGIPYFRR